MDEIYSDYVASHSGYTYSANKRIEEEFKQKERKLLLQQRKMHSKILRQKTLLFDDLIHLHVRTPSCESKSTDGEITEVGDIKLDSSLYAKVFPRKPGQRRPSSNIVSPVLRVVGANVFCNMQNGDDLETELPTRSRTRILLAKSNSICRCLRTLTERSASKPMCKKCLCDREDGMKPLQRAHTFYDTRRRTTRTPERRVTTSCGRHLTKDSLTLNQRSSPSLKYDGFSSKKTECITNYQRYLRDKSMAKTPVNVNDYPSTTDVNCERSHHTKTSSFNHPVHFDPACMRETESEQEVKHESKAKYLAESINYLKRVAGIDVKKRKIFVDSVKISGLSFYDRRETYYDGRVVMKNKWFR